MVVHVGVRAIELNSLGLRLEIATVSMLGL